MVSIRARTCGSNMAIAFDVLGGQHIRILIQTLTSQVVSSNDLRHVQDQHSTEYGRYTMQSRKGWYQDAGYTHRIPPLHTISLAWMLCNNSSIDQAKTYRRRLLSKLEATSSVCGTSSPSGVRLANCSPFLYARRAGTPAGSISASS